MSVSSITWSPTAQWGGGVGAAWGDGIIVPGPPFPGTGANCNPVLNFFAGIIFDANLSQTLRFATVGGVQRILDPPILLSPFQLNIFIASALLDNGPDNRIEVGFVPEPSPANYANGATSVPWGRGEIILETFTLTGLPIFPLPGIMFSFVLSAASTTLIRAHVTSRSNWDGRVAFSFRAAGANAFEIQNFTPNGLAAAVTSQESIFFSGLAGGPPTRARAVRDGRYGMPALSTELIRDGDNPGLFVRPFDWDPEDKEATYRPRPGEGSIDDEISDL